MDTKVFQQKVYHYFSEHKRTLPWRYEVDPYKVLVSEVMLQQTQVTRVTAKYKEWLEVFPTVESLAHASLRDVLIVWQGLGYNRRGKYLREAAEMIVLEHAGRVPDTVEQLIKLPGIGHATAAAIVAYAFNKPVVFIETNIRTVYLYFFFRTERYISDKQITELVEKTLDCDNPRDWYYALTDYGNMLKNKEKFKNTRSKHYTKQSKFEGSRRQVRGLILKFLLENGPRSLRIIKSTLLGDERVELVLAELIDEQLVQKDKQDIYKISDSTSQL